jgi:hypothetical protein
VRLETEEALELKETMVAWEVQEALAQRVILETAEPLAPLVQQD